MILHGVKSIMITIVEAELIRKYKPLWNAVINGLGNHDQGRGASMESGDPFRSKRPQSLIEMSMYKYFTG